MKRFLLVQCVICVLFLAFACGGSGGGENPPIVDPALPEQPSDVMLYVTSATKSMLWTKVALNFNSSSPGSTHTITLDKSVKYQEMDGFGAAITGSTCYNLLKMQEADRAALLKEIFDPETGVGYSYVRISIGCSDFSMDEYTHCDTEGIEHFALHTYDKRDLIPILKEILAINPTLKIMASPWTCPRWMKVVSLSNLTPYNHWTSGQLNPRYYADYAHYFVLFIQAMAQEGIPITSITIQNEPLNRGNSASLYMTWEEQAEFVGEHLGPAFAQNNIKTKIIVFDHNYNYDNVSSQQKYPLRIYEDTQAAPYIDGSAWHAYGGSVSELDAIHSQAPDKNIYFTEMSIGTWSASSRAECFSGDLIWNMREVCLGTINRWCKAVIMWNLLLDDNHGPYRSGGCSTCYGAIDISSSDYKTLMRNSHYYTMAHLSKVIKPGAYRIKSSGYSAAGLHVAAFLNPDGTYAAVVLNENDSAHAVTFEDGTVSLSYAVPAKAVASFRWDPNA